MDFLASSFSFTSAPPITPASMEEYLKPLLSNAGFAGAILVWHVWVVGKKLTAMEEALNRLTKTLLLRLASSSLVTPEVKAEAAGLIEENNEALKRLKSE